jgi:hypothetical protein
MPISTTFKLILGVLVLVVLAYILLKVPHLSENLFNWLSNVLGTSLNTEGKILYIYMDPHDNEMYEFFLTNGYGNQQPMMPAEAKGSAWPLKKGIEEYFMVDIPSGYGDKCLIYTVDEENNNPFFVAPDHGLIYYVPAGVTIDDYCKGASLGGCLSPFDSLIDKGCVDTIATLPSPIPSDISKDAQKCYETFKGKFNFIDCLTIGTPGLCDSPSNSEIAAAQFEPNYNFKGSPTDAFKTGCEVANGKITNPQTCGLLVPGAYQIKYGLICDGGKWKACTEKTPSDAYAVDNKGCTCQCDSNNICAWTGDCAPKNQVAHHALVIQNVNLA